MGGEEQRLAEILLMKIYNPLFIGLVVWGNIINFVVKE